MNASSIKPVTASKILLSRINIRSVLRAIIVFFCPLDDVRRPEVRFPEVLFSLMHIFLSSSFFIMIIIMIMDINCSSSSCCSK